MNMRKIILPKYPNKIKTSESRRKKYYSKESNKTWSYDNLDGYDEITKDYSGPPYDLPAPKTKLIKVYKGGAEWKRKGSYTYLYNTETGKRFVANKRSAGTPNYQIVGGNEIISANNTWVKVNIKNGLKEYYKQFLDVEPIEEFPISIDWKVYTTTDRNSFDLDNFWVYRKYFLDSLVDENIIPDDSIEYITKLCGPELIEIDEWDNRKFEFIFKSLC